MNTPSNMALTFPGKKLLSHQMASHSWRVQIEIEPDVLPSEFKDAAPGSEWVFVVCRKGQEDEAIPPQQPEDKKKKRNFGDLPRVQQAGICCGAKDFQDFLAEKEDTLVVDEEAAKHVLYKWFKIESRKELNEPKHQESWQKVYGMFEQWKTDQRYGDMR